MPSAAIPAQFADILTKKGFALVSTVGRKGPQASVVWYRWDAGSLSFSTTRGRQKLRNLERDPRISVLVLDPDNPYRYVELRGGVDIEPDPSGALIQELSLKYRGEAWRRSIEGRVIVRVHVEHVHTYGS